MDMKNNDQDLTPVGADRPRYHSDVINEYEEEQLEYRDGRYWKTEDGYIAIETMDDQHLANARRHAQKKAGEFLQKQADFERKAEIMLLKYQQLNREAKKRGLLVHQEASLEYDE